ncbi:MAG: MFS transporter [Candidatus Limnocylindria bacterium]
MSGRTRQAMPADAAVAAASAAGAAPLTPSAKRRWRDVRGRLADMTDLGGADRAALLTLFGLNIVDEFDRIAFSTLTPEIRDAFSLTDQEIVAVGSVSSMFVLLAAIPVGYVADRYSRLRMAKVAALVWGVMMLITGTASAVPVLFAARFFSGLARSSNDIAHTGLLVDYYEPGVLPRVFQFYRLAPSIASAASLLAGGIALVLGWRFAFILLALPTFILVLRMRALEEPDRGATIHPAAARAAATATRPPYWGATRQLLRIRSMRRVWISFFFFGIGILAFVQMLALFFEDVYGFGPLSRGFVSFMFGVGNVVGLFVAGHIGTRYARAGDFTALLRITAAGFSLFALGILGLGLAPWPLLSIAFAVLVGAGLGAVTPVLATVMVRVLPPQVRAQGQSFGTVAIAFGALLAIPIAGIGETGDYRLAFVVLAVALVAVVPVIYSARRFLNDDIAAADAALLAALGDP